jgi:hypothetical protein
MSLLHSHDTLLILLQFQYFVTSPSGTGISPKWDFTSTGKFAGNSTAFVIGTKVGDILAPTNPATNIDWLQLARVEGDLASQIFRIDTVNGQPPTSVSPSSLYACRAQFMINFFLFRSVRPWVSPDLR